MRKNAFWDADGKPAKNKTKEELRAILTGALSAEEKINHIRQEQQLFLIIEFANENAVIQNLCGSEELAGFWKSLLADPVEFKRKARWPADNFSFIPQPMIPIFNFISGIYFYYKYLGEKEFFEKNDIKTLEKSIKYGFFPAVLELIDIPVILASVKNNKFEQEHLPKLSSMLEIAQNAAELHGTPGYILLANLCMCAASHFRKNKMEGFSATKFFMQAVSYFEAANILSPACEVASYNASFGQGIKATNVNHFKSIVELQNDCIATAGKYLLPPQIVFAKEQGAVLVATFRNFLPTTELTHTL